MQEFTPTAWGHYSGNLMNGNPPPTNQLDFIEFNGFAPINRAIFSPDAGGTGADISYSVPLGGASDIESVRVLAPAGAGASHFRDPADEAVSTNVGNGTGSIIDNQNQFMHGGVAGWPTLQN